MFRSKSTSNRNIIFVMLILVLTLALTTTAYASTYRNLSGYQAQDCEGNDLEFCLRWGKATAQANIIPVTGLAKDFGYNYWLVFGPAGSQPIDVKPANQ